jgi:hypothetical protein
MTNQERLEAHLKTNCEKCNKEYISPEWEEIERYNPQLTKWVHFHGIYLCPDCFKIVWRNFVMEAK